jgi:hypothetical protein
LRDGSRGGSSLASGSAGTDRGTHRGTQGCTLVFLEGRIEERRDGSMDAKTRISGHRGFPNWTLNVPASQQQQRTEMFSGSARTHHVPTALPVAAHRNDAPRSAGLLRCTGDTWVKQRLYIRPCAHEARDAYRARKRERQRRRNKDRQTRCRDPCRLDLEEL